MYKKLCVKHLEISFITFGARSVINRVLEEKVGNRLFHVKQI